jgi:hypothetical protein
MGYIRAVLLVAGILLLTSCSTSTQVAQAPRFTEADAADFIARYYSDGTSYLLKPATMDGPFRSICDRALLLKLAGQQPRRELAVIVMIHYVGAQQEETTKLAWVNDLKRLGYKRIVFLRGGHRMQVNGLPMLACPEGSGAFSGK